MKAKFVRMGKDKGLILPKLVLEKYKITDSVELILENDRLILKPITRPRKDWDKAFEELHKNGEDVLLIPDVFRDEDTST
ncbi:AbrB/MazE/SpoVT family DNA-binding domain-containing protein [Cytophagales bacterium LB-30]|uniref:AbrB/MazE/SpoVT family DNA-binding domain-containing protein n=1 Tax=Shiella aurantiaca TaxID=3058365 RepID=A0ABT8F5D8_9BACT|nr:AbrB/MazE/SpoVT family DNA-binding domain-containing protein [Shiella aurantiaca]MDN4165605.1 AbrB/MazE/SpoVT family DNA-binding domain-containing protein [Shiella aurantiaca]